MLMVAVVVEAMRNGLALVVEVVAGVGHKDLVELLLMGKEMPAG